MKLVIDWSVYLELNVVNAPEDVYEDIVDNLGAFDAQATTVNGSDLAVYLSVHDVDPLQAAQTAVRVVRGAHDRLTNVDVLAIEVITMEELERRNEATDQPVRPT